MDQERAVTALVLPPLDCRERAPSSNERLVNALVVILLHVVLVYALLYVSVRNDLIDLPPSITARLLPMVEEKTEPARPLPPPPKPQVRKQPVIRPQPVLAVASPAATSNFVVAPQPPAPPPQPIAAPPAPTLAPVAVIAARFDADYLHNPKPVYPALSRRLSEEGKVHLKVRVSAQGTALEVGVSKSSGFARLDAAASEAVARWRFVPARRGDEAVDSSVIVPITFALD